MRIARTARFAKQFQKLPNWLQERAVERAALLLEDPFHPLLHTHGLKGNYQGYRSINVTGDYRIIYQEERDTYRLIAIGTHHELYGT